MSDIPADYRPIVDGDVAHAIGNLVTEWAGAKAMLSMVLTQLMVGRDFNSETDDVMHSAAIIGMDDRIILGLLRTYADLRLKKDIAKQIKDILDKAEKIKELRDLIAHAIWRRNNEGILVAISLKTVGKIKEIHRPLKAGAIWAAVTNLHAQMSGILGYLHSCGYMKSFVPMNGRPY